MSAQYLIRFDDLCPTMNWTVWEEIEATLLRNNISPLLAVVPDNRDDKLVAGPARPDFWKEARKWQARGWTIGLHGYKHEYVTDHRGIAGLHRRSEFAGLSREEQEHKLRRAIEIFRKEEIEPQVWVAPSHSFDWVTVAILRDLGITVISDGFAIAPHQDAKGMLWVPQQLWKFRWRPFGVWTVCYHHNHWTAAQLRKFINDVDRYRGQISAVSKIASTHNKRRRDWLDNFYRSAHRAVLALRS